MPTLALAGGTSASLGRAIVTAILAAQHSTPWDTVILSRSTKRPLWLRAVDPEGLRTRLQVVDYMSVASIVPALHDVDTIVSVTSAVDGSQAQIQINLLHAAVQAGCRRFAPAQWGMGLKCYETGIIKMINEGIWEECDKYQDKIEYGRFNNGCFMNYLAFGIFPPQPQLSEEEELQRLIDGGGYMSGADEAIQGVSPQGDLQDGSGGFLVSLMNGIAELPIKENGDWPRVTATSMRDIGRFVAASLNLPKWEIDMSMVGDTITMGELLVISKDIVGNTKLFSVQRLVPEVLQKGLSTLEEHQFMEALWLEFKLMYCKDEEGLGILAPVMNRMCPEVKPVSVEEFLRFHWPRRHL